MSPSPPPPIDLSLATLPLSCFFFYYNPFRKDKKISYGLTAALIVTLMAIALDNRVENNSNGKQYNN